MVNVQIGFAVITDTSFPVCIWRKFFSFGFWSIHFVLYLPCNRFQSFFYFYFYFYFLWRGSWWPKRLKFSNNFKSNQKNRKKYNKIISRFLDTFGFFLSSDVWNKAIDRVNAIKPIQLFNEFFIKNEINLVFAVVAFVEWGKRRKKWIPLAGSFARSHEISIKPNNLISRWNFEICNQHNQATIAIPNQKMKKTPETIERKMNSSCIFFYYNWAMSGELRAMRGAREKKKKTIEKYISTFARTLVIRFICLAAHFKMANICIWDTIYDFIK